MSEFFARELPIRDNIGGYGMLARHYVAEHLPCEDIEVESVIDFNQKEQTEIFTLDESKNVVFLPGYGPAISWSWFKRFFVEQVLRKRNFFAARAIAERGYDGYLSIEFQNIASTVMQADSKHKLILWLQDPRPQSDWDEIDTLGIEQKGYRPSKKVRRQLRELRDAGRLVVISQGDFLVPKGRDLYRLGDEIEIRTVRNPVEMDADFDLEAQKKEDTILFLGRPDSVKRPWLFYELARRLPEYEFIVCGEAHEAGMLALVDEYRSLENLDFRGHTTGDEKNALLKRAKLLVNTSIHEAVPVSFLEALSYGCLLVSCQPADGLTERFGHYTGRVLGQGRESLAAFEEAIRGVMDDEPTRQQRAREAIAYVRSEHSISGFQQALRKICREAFGE